MPAPSTLVVSNDFFEYRDLSADEIKARSILKSTEMTWLSDRVPN